MTFSGLTSVWEGSDWDLLPKLIPFWAQRGEDHLRMLDCTYGKGTFWKRYEGRDSLIKSDLYQKSADVLKVDFRELPQHWNHPSFDVVVFDPPHWSDKRMSHSSQFEVDRYGGGAPTLVDLQLFYLGAEQVLFPGGIVIVKISDQIHNGKYQWQLGDVINIAREEYFELHDMVVKIRKSPGPTSPKWDRQLHVRRRHSYFVCFKKGK